MANAMDIADFRLDSNRYAGAAALVLVAPFSVINIVQGRYLLGVMSLAIIVLFVAHSWTFTRRRSVPWIGFLALGPAAIICLALAVWERGIIGVLWCYPAVLACYLILPEKQAWVVSGLLAAVISGVVWQIMDPRLAWRVGFTLLTVSVFSAISLHLISRQQERLQQFAVTDPLTGLFNRLLLEASLEQAISYSKRNGSAMTLLAIDLDNFKRINDDLGHTAGDRVLRQLAELLQSRVRRSDRLFRWGGEEFLALLYGTDREAGFTVADELRQAIAAAAFLPNRQITASMGLATLREDENWNDWLKRCDEKLYEAKGSGRNRVCH